MRIDANTTSNTVPHWDLQLYSVDAANAVQPQCENTVRNLIFVTLNTYSPSNSEESWRQSPTSAIVLRIVTETVSCTEWVYTLKATNSTEPSISMLFFRPMGRSSLSVEDVRCLFTKELKLSCGFWHGKTHSLHKLSTVCYHIPPLAGHSWNGLMAIFNSRTPLKSGCRVCMQVKYLLVIQNPKFGGTLPSKHQNCSQHMIERHWW